MNHIFIFHFLPTSTHCGKNFDNNMILFSLSLSSNFSLFFTFFLLFPASSRSDDKKLLLPFVSTQHNAKITNAESYLSRLLRMRKSGKYFSVVAKKKLKFFAVFLLLSTFFHFIFPSFRRVQCIFNLFLVFLL